MEGSLSERRKKVVEALEKMFAGICWQHPIGGFGRFGGSGDQDWYRMSETHEVVVIPFERKTTVGMEGVDLSKLEYQELCDLPVKAEDARKKLKRELKEEANEKLRLLFPPDEGVCFEFNSKHPGPRVWVGALFLANKDELGIFHGVWSGREFRATEHKAVFVEGGGRQTLDVHRKSMEKAVLSVIAKWHPISNIYYSLSFIKKQTS